MILILAVFLVVGCTQKKTDNVNPNNENRAMEKVPSSPIEPEVVIDLKLGEIAGDIKGVFYAQENQVLLSADKLYLYDLDTETILAEASQNEGFDWESYWVIEGGYVSVSQIANSDSSSSMMMESGWNYMGRFYDQDLNVISEFDFNQFGDEELMLMDVKSISFSADGSQVAYPTYSGLYIYDFREQEKTLVVDLETEDAKARAGIVNFEQVGFINDNQRIAFKAQSFDIPVDPNKPSFDTCGIVNIDGSRLSNRTFDNYVCKILTAYNSHLFFAEDPSKATGKVLVMDTLDDQIKMHKLAEEQESSFISGSNGGYYFATSVSNKSGWTIRVYNTETGKVEAEQQVSSDEDYMGREPIIKVLDDSKTIIVLLGANRDDIESKMIVSHF